MLLNPPSRSPRCAAFQHVASDAQRLANTGRICARLASKVLRRVAEQCVENRLCRNVQTASHSTTLAKRVDYLRQRNCPSPATSRPTINDPQRSYTCAVSTEKTVIRGRTRLGAADGLPLVRPGVGQGEQRPSKSRQSPPLNELGAAPQARLQHRRERLWPLWRQATDRGQHRRAHRHPRHPRPLRKAQRAGESALPTRPACTARCGRVTPR